MPLNPSDYVWAPSGGRHGKQAAGPQFRRILPAAEVWDWIESFGLLNEGQRHKQPFIDKREAGLSSKVFNAAERLKSPRPAADLDAAGENYFSLESPCRTVFFACC
ncbi:hypothetical protein [Sutterella wadsworthensis]|uniref:hypothetical protein n=1 Tax=Sutterella wadsworthensis TaxID=40545 RepID=UPI003A8E6BF4